MKKEDVRNLRYNGDGGIDCEINHEELGWIPFTAHPFDVEKRGREIFKYAEQGSYGTVTPYVPPPEPRLTLGEVRDLRLEAYLQESDPLKMEADYDAYINGGPPNYSAWAAKVEEIKERYPLP